MKKLWKMFWPWLLDIAVMILAAWLLCGCRTTRCVPVESVRTEYKDRVVAVHDTVRDSVLMLNDVYRHDSISVIQRGDTVYVDRWHTLLQSSQLQNRAERSKAAHDTLYVTRTDSVRVPVPVERKLTKWEKVRLDFGTIAMVVTAMAIIAGIGVLAWWLRRRIRGNI